MKRTIILVLAAMLQLSVFAEDDKDTTVVIPATGHLPIKTSRNFSGPSGVTVSNFYGSGNSTSPGLKFTNYELGEGVVIPMSSNSSSGLILTAQPGTYTLTLTDQAATINIYTTSASWCASAGTVSKANYRIYKFVNTTDKVGFQRDETYASENYSKCDMGADDHIYMSLGKNPLDRITATLETTVDALAFIPWSDLWGCPSVPTGISVLRTDAGSSADKCYDLQGRPVSGHPQKGIYIINGKKHIVK